ncbi:GNAT family N-acetyltransferase [Oscillatoria sp. FACHB-1407]|uniref:GNAT family N-acetyltransferase n=1 Tax=Oscillatoria sp. FACHB-1407 TaxID=2692847 RepID=UPI001684D182|nr:GNAT family N-acetyltransferase [Oscillatoria sp. FACHB-1407]MBD2463124.1 GNAT family N-acetyltransferase [Oscillatoria sp. FACHB-1407]
MNIDFTIRTAKPEDRSTLVTLMELLQDAECALHSNRSPGSEMGDAHLAYLEELVREQNGQIYVAQSEVDILGFIICFVEKLDDGDSHVVESERTYGYISDLYVVSSMRKRGVAAALMQASEQHFLSLNLAVVRVGSLCSNEPAAKFYQKVGYQPYEIVYEKRLNVK